MELKTALLFGASGLTGSNLLELLLNDNRYGLVTVVVRKPLEITHPKLVQEVNDLFHINEIADKLKGDHLFCCLGTTIAKAKTKEAFRNVDFNFPVKISSIAQSNGVRVAVVISSLGAKADSSNFYLKTKGEMENAINQIGFDKLSFVRPSMLLGSRNESRPGETIGKAVMKALNFVFSGRLKKYKAIPASLVAKAMIEIANTQNADLYYESEVLWNWNEK